MTTAGSMTYDQRAGGAGALGRVYKPDPKDRLHLLASAMEAQFGISMRPDPDSGGSRSQPRSARLRTALASVEDAADVTAAKARRAAALKAVDAEIRTTPWKMGPTRSQGPADCVKYGWRCFEESAPMMTKSTDEEWAGAYEWMQDNDEWPGTAYDGTSVRAGAKWMQKRGRIVNYKWSWDVPTCKTWVRSRAGGILVMGTDWFTGMDTLDKHGFIEPTGSWRGGHCWNAYWYSERLNAWRGKCPGWAGWGQGNDGGDFWLHNDGYQHLLEALNGEACTSTEVRPAATT